MSDILLRVQNVVKTYAGSAGAAVVLRDISFDAGRGETIALVGPSGSGKSTILNIIGLLDRPSLGTITFDGAQVGDLSESQAARLRSRRIGFVFQMHHLLPQCSVLENVLIPTLAASDKTPRKEKAYDAMELLERVGLGSYIHYRPSQLSAGQRQRAAIVRAMINKPVLLLADEPTGSLDQDHASQVAELMIELNRERNTTLILATHAMNLADKMERTYQLTGGMLNRVR